MPRLSLARLTFTLLVLGCATYLVAQPTTKPSKADKPNDPPPGQQDFPEFIVSDLRVQDFPAVNYLFTQQETTLAEIGQAIPPMMNKLEEAITSGEAKVTGAPIFVYDGVTADMSKPFQLYVGFPVAEGTKPQGDLQVKKLEPYHCATAIFSGSMENVGQAYQKVFAEIMQAGLKPTGGTREMHMYFESPESPNNIFQIQVAVSP
jgi:effector-binding domain-containing protein